MVDALTRRLQQPFVSLEYDPAFVAGKNAAIRDLGEMPLGFADPKFYTIEENQPAVQFTWDAFAGATPTNAVQNGGAYSVPWRSVNLVDKHMYILAVGDPDEDGPSTAYYHYFFVEDQTSNIFNVSARLSLATESAAAASE